MRERLKTFEWWKHNLKYLIIFLLPVLLILLTTRWVDNDSWFVLAEGRQIVEHGIYKTDVLSMHSDLTVTVQNYGFAAIFWLIYSAFGLGGLYVGMIVCFVAMEILLYKIFRLLSKENEVLSIILTMIVSVLMSLMYAVTRAQVLSYVIFLAVIYILERYRSLKEQKYLWVIPLLAVLQINLHASLWPMLLLVIAVFALESRIEGHKLKPIIVVGLISVGLGLVNPYGVEMMLFTVRSYTGVAVQSLVSEMAPFSLSSWKSALLYGGIVMALVLGFYGDKRRVRAGYMLLFFGLLGLGLNTIKGMSQVILVMFMPIAGMYAKAKWPKIKNLDIKKKVDIGVVATAVLMLGVVGWRLGAIVSNLKEGPDRGMVETVNKMDEIIGEEKRKDEVKVYSGYNDGGYLEFRGYKPYLDPRAEVFLTINNNKEDILVEWIKLSSGKIDINEFVEKYKFDYIVARGDDDPLYVDEIAGYKLIYETNNNDTKLYERI